MNAEPRKPPMVNCPKCGTATLWSPSNPYRPFCSERCKVIDLGQWATESYRISQEESDAGQSDGDER
jgi:endogenous inhibitor of DNA gyrase (YacG/DUF329 family)